MEQICELIPFDSGKWVSGSVQHGKGIAHAIHLFRQPATLMQDYFCLQNDDLLLSRLLADPGHTLNLYDVISRDQWTQMDIYRNYCKRYGIEHALSTAISDAKSGLLTVFSIYRNDYKHGFTAAEKALKGLLTPVLADARNLNLFLNLSVAEADTASAMAVCDGKGILREAEPLFADMLRTDWPDWQGPRLNFTPEELLAGNAEARFSGAAISINLTRCHNLILLHVRKKNSSDALTCAERAVMERLMQGLANKEIARELATSPKTVGHHLQSIYKKLGVVNRTQALAQFRE